MKLKKEAKMISEAKYLFMQKAADLRSFSKDPHRQVGACVVLNNKVTGIGYNEFPKGTRFQWKKKGPWLQTKHPYVTHAEVKAFAHVLQDSLKGKTLVAEGIPCYVCSRLLSECGISRVVHKSCSYWRRPTFWASKLLFKERKIKTFNRSTNPSLLRSGISFTAINKLRSINEDDVGSSYIIDGRGKILGNSKHQYELLSDTAKRSLTESLSTHRHSCTSSCSPPDVNNCNHSAAAAIFNSNPSAFTSSQLFVTLQPCNECAELILLAGVAGVCYIQNIVKPEYKASRKLLERGGVRMEQLKKFKLQPVLPSASSA